MLLSPFDIFTLQEKEYLISYGIYEI